MALLAPTLVGGRCLKLVLEVSSILKYILLRIEVSFVYKEVVPFSNGPSLEVPLPCDNPGIYSRIIIMSLLYFLDRFLQNHYLSSAMLSLVIASFSTRNINCV